MVKITKMSPWRCSVNLMEHLENYLTYMGQIGFEGLTLERNPFKCPPRSESKPVSGAPKPAKATTPFPPPAAKKGGKVEIPNLFSIMEMVTPVSGKEENEKKALAVTGEDKVEVLRRLYQSFHTCQACALGTTRNRFVFGEGSPDSRLMFIGEGPGRDEDLQGRPFVGKAGQLLDRIIQAMGLKRAEVFIANVVKCRPPENRVPLPDEMATCSPILERQILCVNPKAIVVLGGTALRFFKETETSITRNRGRFFQWRDYWVMPTFHPAYILRNPRAKRDVWEDMQKVMERLKDS